MEGSALGDASSWNPCGRGPQETLAHGLRKVLVQWADMSNIRVPERQRRRSTSDGSNQLVGVDSPNICSGTARVTELHIHLPYQFESDLAELLTTSSKPV